VTSIASPLVLDSVTLDRAVGPGTQRPALPPR